MSWRGSIKPSSNFANCSVIQGVIRPWNDSFSQSFVGGLKVTVERNMVGSFFTGQKECEGTIQIFCDRSICISSLSTLCHIHSRLQTTEWNDKYTEETNTTLMLKQHDTLLALVAYTCTKILFSYCFNIISTSSSLVDVSNSRNTTPPSAVSETMLVIVHLHLYFTTQPIPWCWIELRSLFHLPVHLDLNVKQWRTASNSVCGIAQELQVWDYMKSQRKAIWSLVQRSPTICWVEPTLVLLDAP